MFTFTDPATYSDAQATCERYGGNLACPRTPYLQNEVIVGFGLEEGYPNFECFSGLFKDEKNCTTTFGLLELATKTYDNANY